MRGSPRGVRPHLQAPGHHHNVHVCCDACRQLGLAHPLSRLRHQRARRACSAATAAIATIAALACSSLQLRLLLLVLLDVPHGPAKQLGGGRQRRQRGRVDGRRPVRGPCPCQTADI